MVEVVGSSTGGLGVKRVALLGMLSAVYVVGSYLPGFPVLGLTGSKIDLVRALEIGYGVVLGPVYGPLTVFIGAVVGKTLTGGGVGLLFTPLAPVTAFTASMLSKRSGWRFSAAVIVLIIAAWLVTPVGRLAPGYVVLHVSGLAVVLFFRDRVSEMISSGDKRTMTFGFVLCSYPSTLAGHLLGGVIYALAFSPAPEFFMAVLPISVLERLVITVIASLVGVPLVLAVRQAYPRLMEG